MWHEDGDVECVECKGQQYALKALPNRYPKPLPETLHPSSTPYSLDGTCPVACCRAAPLFERRLHGWER
jgi:hypothetical protein